MRHSWHRVHECCATSPEAVTRNDEDSCRTTSRDAQRHGHRSRRPACLLPQRTSANPPLSLEKSDRPFGKNRNGHGHDDRLEVTGRGRPRRQTGMLLDVRELDRLVEKLLDLLDHRRLNVVVRFIAARMPTSENPAVFGPGPASPRAPSVAGRCACTSPTSAPTTRVRAGELAVNAPGAPSAAAAWSVWDGPRGGVRSAPHGSRRAPGALPDGAPSEKPGAGNTPSPDDVENGRKAPARSGVWPRFGVSFDTPTLADNAPRE
ncbi:MAG: 6-carboxytetrahydropterin synthase [Candidatus Krumholzibacteriia bacterium]